MNAPRLDPQPPRAGDAVVVARWREEQIGVGAALLVRARTDGDLGAETVFAVREESGHWSPLDISNGTADYPDVFHFRPESSEVTRIGESEVMLPAPPEWTEGAWVRLVEVVVGDGIVGAVCETDGRECHQEISPIGVLLVGCHGAQPAKVRFLMHGNEPLRDSTGQPLTLDL